MTISIGKPYLLFLGDAPDPFAAKTAFGLAFWRRNTCIGQLRLPGCNADVGLPDLSVKQAVKMGAKTMIIGVANRGGHFSPAWIEQMVLAIENGLDISSGLHERLNDIPELTTLTAQTGRRLFDVRQPISKFEIGTGRKRSGKRLLTVATDCSSGKMYTALALEKEMLSRGINCHFRATGQTGILIAGEGISIDAVVADFISGAVEELSPDNDPSSWDIIEGQGSLFHPSFAGVSLGLLHGAQPDALVVCHDPNRIHMRGLPDFALPDLADCIAANEAAARLTNPKAVCIGLSLNTSGLESITAAKQMLADIEAKLGMPCVDPVRTGVDRLVDHIVDKSCVK